MSKPKPLTHIPVYEVVCRADSMTTVSRYFMSDTRAFKFARIYATHKGICFISLIYVRK